MFECKLCGMKDLPRECMVIDKDKVRCVCCDFEDFIRADDSPNSDEVIARILDDILRRSDRLEWN